MTINKLGEYISNGIKRVKIVVRLTRDHKGVLRKCFVDVRGLSRLKV